MGFTAFRYYRISDFPEKVKGGLYPPFGYPDKPVMKARRHGIAVPDVRWRTASLPESQECCRTGACYKSQYLSAPQKVYFGKEGLCFFPDYEHFVKQRLVFSK